jgi:hypothetical protein
MKDIFDIKKVKTSFVLDFLFYPIYIIVFFMFFYYVLNKFLNIDNEKKQVQKIKSDSFDDIII